MPVFEVKFGHRATGQRGNRGGHRFVFKTMGRKRPLGTSLVVLVLFALSACESNPEERPAEAASPEASSSPSPSGIADAPQAEGSSGSRKRRTAPPVFLVWAPGGLTDEALFAARRADGVQRAPIISGGTLWMDKASAGKQPPSGYSIPIEVAFAQPNAFAGVVPSGETIPVLDFGEAVMAETAHTIRGRPEVPFTLHTDHGSLRVIGLVPDETAAGFEVVASGTPPAGWGARYTIASGRGVTTKALRRATAPHVDGPLRVRAAEDTPFLRHADAVHPPMLLKEVFGEFAARPLSDGRLDMHPGWVERNIVEEEVPSLGRVTCHRTFLEVVRDALGSARRQGIARFIDPGGYAGCYSARFILSDPSGRLSSHAWGAAIDINAPGNAYGAEPTMDSGLVRHMEEWGLYWGGRWMIPDGMHFEWGRFLD